MNTISTTGTLTIGGASNTGNITVSGLVDLPLRVALITNGTGIANVNADVGDTVAIHGLSITANSGIRLGANITSATNPINFNNATTLTANNIVITNSGDINFNNTIDSFGATPFALTLSSGSGNINVNTAGFDNIGATNSLGAFTINGTGTTTLGGTVTANSVTANAGGSLMLNGGSVTTNVAGTGTQNYFDNVIVGADTNFATTNSAVNFSGSLNGAHNITVAAGSGGVSFNTVGLTTAPTSLSSTGSGTVTFNGVVGSNSVGDQLGSVSITGNSVFTNNDAVYTTGNQTYTGAVNVGTGSALTFNSINGNGAIHFFSTMNGANNVSVSSGTGALTFDGAIGSITPLGSLTTNGGVTAFNSSGVASASPQQDQRSHSIIASPRMLVILRLQITVVSSP